MITKKTFWMLALLALVVPLANAEFAMQSHGPWHSLYVENGNVYATGHNQHGQLGVDALVSKDERVQVPGLTDIVGVHADRFISLALASDGTVYGWGLNNDGQLVPQGPQTIKSPTAITTATSDASIHILEDSILIDDGAPKLQGIDSRDMTSSAGQHVRFGQSSVRQNYKESLASKDPDVTSPNPVDQLPETTTDSTELRRLIAQLQQEIAGLQQRIEMLSSRPQSPDAFGTGVSSIQQQGGDVIITLQ